MNFFIGQNSTFPVLYYPITSEIMEKYNITDDMMEYTSISFSMIDQDNGFYRIANVGADLVVNDDIIRKYRGSKYVLAYQFTVKQTRKSGVYLGEFKLDFLDEYESCSKITLPATEPINIIIKDSITYSEVV